MRFAASSAAEGPSRLVCTGTAIPFGNCEWGVGVRPVTGVHMFFRMESAVVPAALLQTMLTVAAPSAPACVADVALVATAHTCPRTTGCVVKCVHTVRGRQDLTVPSQPRKSH